MVILEHYKMVPKDQSCMVEEGHPKEYLPIAQLQIGSQHMYYHWSSPKTYSITTFKTPPVPEEKQCIKNTDRLKRKQGRRCFFSIHPSSLKAVFHH